MTFPTQTAHDLSLLRPLYRFAPTVLTAVIDDWTKGMDSSWPFHDAKERFWGLLACIADCHRTVLSSVSNMKIAIREKCPSSNEMQSRSIADTIIPAGPSLLKPYRPWERQIEESDFPSRESFLLKECKQAHYHIRTSAEHQANVVKIVCLVYNRIHQDREVHWTLDEVSDIWPRAELQQGAWVWHNMNDPRSDSEHQQALDRC